jgi:carotenoid cleavage dioxygenase-like enzyme
MIETNELAALPVARTSAVSAPRALGSLAPFRSRALDGPLGLDTQLEGKLPDWLKGDLVRVAPAVFELPQHASGRTFRAGHWFDGLGMLFRFRIRDGKVSYRQSLLETKSRKRIADGDFSSSGFGTQIVRSFWRRLISPRPPIPDNTNVNVLPLGDERIALTEGPTQWGFDAETLAATKPVQYADSLKDAMMIAHAHYDFEQRKVVNVAFKLGRPNEIIVYEHAPNSRERKVVGSVKTIRLPYLHGFGLTPRHAIVIGHSFDLNTLSMLWSNGAFIDHFKFRPEQGTKLWLIDRATGEVRTHLAPAGFVFHIANAFEDGEKTVVDVALYPDPSIIDRLRRDALLANGLPSLAPSIVRYTMTPGQEHARVELLLEDGFEFPSVSYKQKSGVRHGVTWGTRIVAGKAGAPSRNTVVRLDANGSTREHTEENVAFGEPIFVAKPGGAGEDEGVLLVVGADAKRDESQLRVLDARTLDVVAQASVAVPIPLGFHGSFFGDR